MFIQPQPSCVQQLLGSVLPQDVPLGLCEVVGIRGGDGLHLPGPWGHHEGAGSCHGHCCGKRGKAKSRLGGTSPSPPTPCCTLRVVEGGEDECQGAGGALQGLLVPGWGSSGWGLLLLPLSLCCKELISLALP